MRVGDPGTEQFFYSVRENGVKLDGGPIHDPFIHTVIRPKGLRAALLVLLGRLEWTVRVDGTNAAYRVVMGSDYTQPPELCDRFKG